MNSNTERFKNLFTKKNFSKLIHALSTLLFVGYALVVFAQKPLATLTQGEFALMLFGLLLLGILETSHFIVFIKNFRRQYLYTVLNCMGVIMLILAISPGDYFVTLLMVLGFTFLIAFGLI